MNNIDKITITADELRLINLLSEEDRGAASLAVFEYCFYGEEPKGLSESARAVFDTVAKNVIKRAKDAARVKRHRNKNGEG